MANTRLLGPLDWKTSIVDAGGRPTPEFQRKWAALLNNNGLIVTAMSQLLFVVAPVAVAIPGAGFVNFGPSGLRLADATSGYRADAYAAQAYPTVGAPATVLIPTQNIPGTWVEGTEYWLSTAGTVTSTPPTSGYAQLIGHAYTAGQLLFHPLEMVSPL